MSKRISAAMSATYTRITMHMQAQTRQNALGRVIHRRDTQDSGRAGKAQEGRLRVILGRAGG